MTGLSMTTYCKLRYCSITFNCWMHFLKLWPRQLSPVVKMIDGTYPLLLSNSSQRDAFFLLTSLQSTSRAPVQHNATYGYLWNLCNFYILHFNAMLMAFAAAVGTLGQTAQHISRLPSKWSLAFNLKLNLKQTC